MSPQSSLYYVSFNQKISPEECQAINEFIKEYGPDVLCEVENDKGLKIEISNSVSPQQREDIIRGIQNVIHPDDFKMKAFYIITMIVALCSMIYEFMIAETISALMGNTVLRYNITIGLYIASMGIGALLYKKIFFQEKTERAFVKTEIALAIVGFLSPILLLLVDYLFRPYNQIEAVQYIISILNHSFIILVGVITGMEIPLIIDIVKKHRYKAIGKILFFDYIGCFIGAIAFPLVLMPNMNLFQIGTITALANVVLAFASIKLFKINDKKYKIWIAATFVFLAIFLSLEFWNFIIEILYVK